MPAISEVIEKMENGYICGFMRYWLIKNRIVVNIVVRLKTKEIYSRATQDRENAKPSVDSGLFVFYNEYCI